MDSSLTKKTGVVFLDLTAAYDAVWHLSLLQKLSKTLPRWIVDTVALFLRDRRFRVQIADKCSSWRLQRNGLPLGSVLSPCLFIVYINDLPSTHSRKFNCSIKRPHFHVISCRVVHSRVLRAPLLTSAVRCMVTGIFTIADKRTRI